MYLSVIIVHTLWYEYVEMLIPKVIGVVKRGYARVVNISRLLPLGHRTRWNTLELV